MALSNLRVHIVSCLPQLTIMWRLLCTCLFHLEQFVCQEIPHFQWHWMTNRIACAHLTRNFTSLICSHYSHSQLLYATFLNSPYNYFKLLKLCWFSLILIPLEYDSIMFHIKRSDSSVIWPTLQNLFLICMSWWRSFYARWSHGRGVWG